MKEMCEPVPWQAVIPQAGDETDGTAGPPKLEATGGCPPSVRSAPLLAVAAAVAALLLPGCATSTAVHVKDYRFQPDEMSVAAGTVLQFLNDGPSRHTVTVHDKGYNEVHDAELDVGQSTQVTLAGTGDYHVFCRLHPQMALTVHVE